MKATPARLSAILWTVNLASIAACVFSYVFLAYHVYRTTGSLLLSEVVLTAPLVVPVLLCLVINRLAGSSRPRTVLWVSNVAGIAIAVLTYASVEQHVGMALVGVLLIGLVDAIQRVARTVAIKRYFASADVSYALPITLTAQFIAGAIAGLALSLFPGEFTPGLAGSIAVIGFLIAAAAACALPVAPSLVAVPGQHPPLKGLGTLATLGALLRRDPALRKHFVAFVVVVSVLQGFFNVSRIALPLHVLHLPQAYVGYLQIIGATAALVAALAFALFTRRGWGLGARVILVMSSACLLAMLGASTATEVLGAYMLFAVYMFFWEILFFKYQSDLVKATPAEHMGLLATFQYAAVYAGMLILGFAGGVITEAGGLGVCALVFVLLYLLGMGWNAMGGRAARSERGAAATE